MLNVFFQTNPSPAPGDSCVSPRVKGALVVNHWTKAQGNLVS